MYTSIFKSRSRRQSQQQRNKRRFNLACESLEGRQLLASIAPSPSFLGNLSGGFVYGTTLNASGYPSSDLAKNAGGDTLAGSYTFSEGNTPIDPASTLLDAGSHTLSVTFTPSSTDTLPDGNTVAEDYNSAIATWSIDVSKEATIAVADAQTKVYGQSDPTLTFKIYDAVTFNLAANVPSDAYVNGATTIDGTIDADGNYVGTGTQIDTTHASVGKYVITPYEIDINSSPDFFVNHTIDGYYGNNLQITPATLTITADSQTKVYGASDPTLTYSYGTLQNGDSSSVFSGSLTRDAGETVDGGPYAISLGTLSAGSNYNISYTGSSLTITPATLIVTANNTTMVLGGPVPTFSAYYIGLVNGDTVSSLGNLSLSFTPGSTTASGTSTITLSGNATSTDSDYAITYEPGTQTVNTKPPFIIGLPLIVPPKKS